MKGKIMRKACAAVFAMMIVSGIVPSNVGTKLFDSFSANAVEVPISGTETIGDENCSYEFKKDTNGNLLIQTEDDWNGLAELVKNGFDCKERNFLMINDLKVTRPIGQQVAAEKTSRMRFAGSFDGGNNTLDVDLSSESRKNKDNKEEDYFKFNKGYVSPFAYVSNTTIKNLHVTGKVTTKGQWASGLVGSSGQKSSDGACTIENVHVSVTIDNEYKTSGSSFANHGGFIGIAEGKATIKNSWFDGSFTGKDYQHSGGFIGLNKTEEKNKTSLENCLFNPSHIDKGLNVNGASEFVHASDVKYVFEMEKCYSVYLFGEPQNAQGIHVKKTVSAGDDYTTVLAADGVEYYIVSANRSWPSLQLAFKNNNSITLNRDYTAGENDTCLTVPDNKEFTLDLNGHTIDRGLYLQSPQEDGCVIKVGKNSTLTITDTAGTGTIVGGNNTSSGGGIYNEGTLIIENVKIGSDANDNGNRSNADGGGIYNAGTLTLKNCAITGNDSTGSGGGIFNAGTLTLIGGVIKDNSSVDRGSGVYVQKDSVFNVSGAVNISDNTYTNNPKNVYLDTDTFITVKGDLSGSSIGVAKKGTSGIFTKGLADNGTADNFTSDNSILVMRISNGEATLAKLYHITVEDSSGGTVTSDRNSAIYGETVKLTVIPDKYYSVKKVCQNGTEITPVFGVYTFKVQSKDVIVTAEFEYTGAQAVTFSGVTDGVVSKIYGDEPFTQKATAVGDIAYSSSNNDVATVDSEGNVTIISAGDTVITADAAAKDEYAEGTASYKLKVNKKELTVSGLSAENKDYDATTKVTINGTAALCGVLDADSQNVSINYSKAKAEFADKNVGDGKAVVFTGYALKGNRTKNYSLIMPKDITANIKAIEVTVDSGIKANDKDYDGKADATFDCSQAVLNGKIEEDYLSVSAEGTFADVNVGNGKKVNITKLTLEGTDKGNYVLASEGNQADSTANIAQGTYENKPLSSGAMSGYAKTVDISYLIDSGCAIGTITEPASDSILAGTPTIENGKLTFKLKNDAAVNSKAEVNVPISCDNYTYNIVLTITAEKAPIYNSNEKDSNGNDVVKGENQTVELDSTNDIKVKLDDENAKATIDKTTGDVTVEGKSEIKVNENDTTVDCTLTTSENGKITIDNNADEFSKMKVEGEKCEIKLGQADVILKKDQTAYISEDGKHALVVDNKGNASFYSSVSGSEVDMPSALAGNNGIKAVEVNDNATINDAEVNKLINWNTEGDKEIISVDAIDENGKKINSIDFGDTNGKPNKVKVRIPISSEKANAVLRYIDPIGALINVKFSIEEETVNGVTKYYLVYETTHFSSWVYGQATGLTITKTDAENGDYTVKVNNNVPTSSTNIKSGDKVTISVVPDRNFRLSSLTYKGADTKETVSISAKGSDYEFTMPGESVTIKAVFDRIVINYIDYTETEIDGVGYHIHPDYVGVYEGDTDIENVVIKSEVEGLPVTTIEAGAFNSFKKIKSISLPDTLTTIEQGAFWGCAALEEIDIPESVTSIGSSAFSYCKSLKKFIVRNKNCNIAMYSNTLYNDHKLNKYVYDGVIVGYSGSTVEKYANKFKYTFEDIEKTAVTTTTTSTSTLTLTSTSTSITSSTTTTTKNTTITTVTLGKVNDLKIANDGKITWSKAENAVEYRVVKVIGDKKYKGSKVAHRFYYFDNIPNEDYKLYVVAYGADGKYTTGKTLSVKVNAVGKAAAPTVAKDGTVTWKAVGNAVKYKVVKIVNGNYYGGSETTDTSYKFRSIPVSDYQVYVVSYGENGAKTIGAKAAVKVDKPLGFVNDVKVSADGKVTWSKAKNATSYRVVKVFNNKKFYGTETKTNSYKFEKSCYKDYQVYVIAYGENNRLTTGKRTTVEVGDLGVVLDPKVDKNGKVSWTAVRGAVKYKVCKVVDDKKNYGVADGTSFTFKNVPQKDYKVYVISFDSEGKYRVGTTKTVKVN